jgi:hypothetical protein
LEQFAKDSSRPSIAASSFLAADAYRPLPKLVNAARELFHKGDLTPIHRARAATDPAVEEISRIIHEAARNRGRRLVLVSGIPGAGKTLVGLRTVHAHFLDDLAVPRADEKPTAPAVFLSGNGPLVEVLQYELRAAGGGGKTFVRGVKDYVKRYSGRSDRIPPEHVLVFDEAQRAFDAAQVHAKHRNTPGFRGGKSEPEHFIEFAERVPEWCVVVALIGGGQEIHIGEEAGLVQWRHAVERSVLSRQWRVHGPAEGRESFAGCAVPYVESNALNLDQEIRYHSASDLHRFVKQLLQGDPAERNAEVSHSLERSQYHLRITRELDQAKNYLRERYATDPAARFGLVASSRDRDLEAIGIPNAFNHTRNVRFGPWYADAEDAPGAYSCRHLQTCVTEFGAQGLELENVLLAWGTDLLWKGDHWSSENARRYQNRSRVRDPHQLRLNAYRVLLTRGRDGTVVFVPPLVELNATYDYLVASGFRCLQME